MDQSPVQADVTNALIYKENLFQLPEPVQKSFAFNIAWLPTCLYLQSQGFYLEISADDSS